MTTDKDALLSLTHELDGVIEDYRLGISDETCISTVRLVRDRLRAAALAGQDDCVRVPRSLVEELHEYFAQDMYSGGGWYFADKRREEIAALLAAAKGPK